MADWRTLAKRLILADGVVGPREAVVLQRELFADGRLDRGELDFLVELRREATSLSQAFEDFFFGVIRRAVIKDRGISGEEARWLRGWVLADGKVHERELRLLKELREGAVHLGPEFEDLCREAVQLLQEEGTDRAST